MERILAEKTPVVVAQGTYGVLLQFTVTDEDGAVIDLTGTTVTMRWQEVGSDPATVAAVEAACILTGYGLDQTQGECGYVTVVADAADVAAYWVQLDVTDGSTYIYRNPRHALLHVVRSATPQ